MTTSPATEPAPEFNELSARRLGPVRQFFVRRPVAMDVLVMAWFGVPAILTALATPLTTGAVPGDPGSPVQWLRSIVVGLVFAAAGTVVLFWRRRWPVVVLCLMTGLGVAVTALTGSTGGFELGVALALYAVAASRPVAATWLSFGGSILALSGAAWLWVLPTVDVAATPAEGDEVDAALGGSGARIASVVVVVIFGLLAVAIGTSVRNRRLHLADLIERANALARDRDQQAMLARAAERSRIAREMHDVVAHSLSVMIALADGAGAALDKAPERSRLALDELSSTGRSALADMRRVLGVLNEPGAPFEPQPASEDLAELVERFRTAGMSVHTTGLARPLPADQGLQLTVYRIVQESLTNVLRHAPATPRVDVELSRPPGAIEVRVADLGSAAGPSGTGDAARRQPAGTGRGIIGMRERASVYAGTVEAGPWHSGWQVRAVLPWKDDHHDDDDESAAEGTT